MPSPARIAPKNIHLTEKELAERWRTSIRALRLRRVRRQDPAYLKIGKQVLYVLADVEAFEQQQRVEAKA